MSINPVLLSNSIKNTYTRYLKSTFRLKDDTLYRSFEQELDNFGFTKGPILESTPPMQAGVSLKKLVEEQVLDELFLQLAPKAFPYLSRKPLYVHQEQAIRKSVSGENVVITSGTGSGKTEAFLIPILNELFRQYRRGLDGMGVRALILYPMNALANDQLRRLREISKHLYEIIPQMGFTFGRYIGETHDNPDDALKNFHQSNPGKKPAPGELLSRKQMREHPPQILITNYAMLEYLLIRPMDTPLFNRTEGGWTHLVLDEAHTYTGAKGNEIAMLIRRLKDAIGIYVENNIQCIATSATLVAKESELPKVAHFASTIFNEPFPSENVLRAKTCPRTIGISDNLVKRNPTFYLSVKERIESAPTNESALTTLKSVLIEEGISVGEDCKNYEIATLLYFLLEKDYYLFQLENILAEQPISVDELGIRLFDEGESEDPIKSVTALVDLAARARANEDSIPLLPARYHFFVRAPEGAFMRFAPQPKILLDRYEVHEGYCVFEIGTCRRCGQEYLVGVNRNNKLLPVHELEEDGSSFTHSNFYLPLRFHQLLLENEDEKVAVPEEKEKKGITYRLCYRCGTLSLAESNGPCECGALDSEHGWVMEIESKNSALNQCFSCGLRAPNIVRKFLFQKDAPSAVLATSLFTNIQEDTRQRRILTFSDSRQDAAFFAPYLDYTYKRILFRRLMAKALINKTESDYRLSSLFSDVHRHAIELHLWDSVMDEREQKQETWRWIIQEFAGLWDRRNSLEGVGLISFSPRFPEKWSPPYSLTSSPWNLSYSEISTLYELLLDTLRYNFVINLPGEAPMPTDSFFTPRNREYYIRSSQADMKKGIYAWCPNPSFSNSRCQLLEKIGKEKGVDREAINTALADIWADLTANWLDSGIAIDDNARKGGTRFRIDHRYWNVDLTSERSLYICNNCRSLTTKNIRDICPTYNCDGRLDPVDAKTMENLRENHYRMIYTTLSPAKVEVREHTAQLASDYATRVQQEFISGKVNILSCSTTFELGVDLGELETVFLKNVPPEPANYVQRVGRAGRRTGSVGYALTFVQRRSHDLNHYRSPFRMINGEFKPPMAHIENEKIVRRHIHSVALAAYLNKHCNFYGNLNSFIRFDSEEYQSDLLKAFLESKPQEVKDTITRVCPPPLMDVMQIKSWGWVDKLVGPSGALRIAEEKIRDEYTSLHRLIEEKKNEYTQAENQRQRKGINNKIDWAERRMNTLKRMGLIDFLSSNVVLPKYGFPVDVVDLTLLSNKQAGRNVRLERDLKIAISEFAPSSKIVANGYVWESTGLRVVPNRAWEENQYAVCENCGRFHIAAVTNELPEVCEGCKSVLSKTKRHRFVIPIFGFISGTCSQTQKAGLYRPHTAFGSRPYFYDYEAPEEEKVNIWGIPITRRYSHRGSLAVISRGQSGAGYLICENCGYAADVALARSKKRNEKGHYNPYGNHCFGKMRGPLDLGHTFETDVMEISIDVEHRFADKWGDFELAISILYALLEGLSTTLDIQRTEVNGCLHPRLGGYSLILFDEVPGGAGHVSRVRDEATLVAVFEEAFRIVSSCSCGPETSCYSCLRNYKNQYVHHHLKRGAVVDFFRK